MALGEARFLAITGLLFCWHQYTPSKFLAVLYALVTYKYSMKMSLLILICAPIVSVLAGFFPGILADWCLEQFIGLFCGPRRASDNSWATFPARTGGMGSIGRTLWAWVGSSIYPAEVQDMLLAKDKFSSRISVILLAVAIFAAGTSRMSAFVTEFARHADSMAPRMGNPDLAFQTTLRSGEPIIVDDYVKGYRWIRENTPEDARVMAWWDSGWQITGISNRTSIADGNLWNHEHIATLGRILTSPEKRAHNAMRHLTDYVMVWAGDFFDDISKSPHLARIGNSVFPDHCGDDDPLCTKFGSYQGGVPTPMMEKSFLYKAVYHRVKEGVKLNSKLFQEVHSTKYGLLRVYQVLNVSQESKDWVANPANRKCDAPGSWYCVGQYPPAIQPLIEKRRNFAQLEETTSTSSTSTASALAVSDELLVAEDADSASALIIGGVAAGALSAVILAMVCWLGFRHQRKEREGRKQTAAEAALPAPNAVPEELAAAVVEPQDVKVDLRGEGVLAASGARLSCREASELSGVSAFWVLCQFPTLARNRTRKKNPTFHDMCKVLAYGNQGLGFGKICPRDGRPNCSVVDALDERNRGMATDFVSWCWNYTLDDFVSAVSRYVEQSGLDARDVYLWVCFFCNNQYRIFDEHSKNGADNLEELFERRLVSIGRMVIILDRFTDPGYITRLWCIFESYVAVTTGIPIELTAPDAAVGEMEHKTVSNMKECLNKMDARTATASFKADEDKIKNLIATTIGFETVNSQVKDLVASRIIAAYTELMSRF